MRGKYPVSRLTDAQSRMRPEWFTTEQEAPVRNRNSFAKALIAGGVAIILALIIASNVSGASGQAGQCPGYNDPANVKIDTSDDDLVLPAGLTICIHAGGENTGIFQTDGVLTLGGYIIEFGLKNNGGQTPGVSNYVIYGGGTQPSSPPTAAPTAAPTVTPTSTPTAEPTVTPTGTPIASEQPSDSPGSSESPSAPTATPIQPVPTPPSTDTASEGSPASSSVADFLFLVAALWFIWALTSGPSKGRTPGRFDLK